VTVAKRPEDFADGDATRAARREGWLVAGQVFEDNPKALLTSDDDEMLRIWLWTRVGDFGGARPLPDRGGIQDQAAVMMDAIRIMDTELARLQAEEKR
jgi:hypothetical protein